MSSPSPFRVLITGGTGYLGTAMIRRLHLARPQWEVHATFFTQEQAIRLATLHYLDLRDPASVERLLLHVRPQVIIHTAAQMTGPLEQLRQVNVLGASYIAQGASQSGARLVHLSTDVIFDGERGNYREADRPHPVIPYGQSKYEGELAVLASGVNTAIVRTSLIYGFKPLDPRTQAVLNGKMPQLFTDEMRCPIWVDTLCEALLELSESTYTGILHVAGSQALSRYAFGCKLMQKLNGDVTRLIPMKSEESGLIRPRDCTLDISQARQVLKTALPGVDDVLQNHLIA
ncbi:MAG: SDR family oxidoreductase [Anaerolineae bacterium]